MQGLIVNTEELQPISLEVSYKTRTFNFTPDAYLKICKMHNWTPTQEKFKKFCELEIYECLESVVYQMDIKEVDNHVWKIDQISSYSTPVSN